MRTVFCSILFLGLLSGLAFGEGSGRPVHHRPDSDSPIIGTLPHGSTPIPATDAQQLTQEAEEKGWKAISFVDNFRGFVKQTQLRKDFSVTAGTPIYLSATENPEAVLARAARNDLFEVEQLDGTWAQVSFRKPVTGFVRDNGVDTSSPVSTAAPERRPEAVPVEEMEAESTSHPRVASRAGIPTDGTLRAFEGWLSPTRSFFGRQPPFSHQIVDQSGNRIAYVDLNRLLITTPMDRFYGRKFEFYGRAEPLEGRRDFVIRVERMLQK